MTGHRRSSARICSSRRTALAFFPPQWVITSWNGGAERLYGHTEAEAVGRISHPNLVSVYEVGEWRETEGAPPSPYLVLEYVSGGTLEQRLNGQPQPTAEAARLVEQLARALHVVHQQGIIHRDLKPANILVDASGQPKVLDFGIAGGIDATRLTQAGEVFGTPQYMSPEQCNGLPLDHRTDIYSLAIILYEMIEGRPPFSAETPMATMLKHVRAKVPIARNANKETGRILSMGLRKDRGKRIQTAGRFAELIGECIGHLRAIKDGRETSPTIPSATANSRLSSTGITTRRPVSSPRPPSPTVDTGMGDQAGKLVAILLGVAALGLVGVMVFGGLGSSSSSDPEPEATPASEDKTDDADAEASGDEGPTYDSFPFNRALVRTNVTGAKVFVDGEPQCETPCEIKVPVGDGVSHEIKLVKDGYVDVQYNWRPKNVGEPLPVLPDMKEL